MKVCIVSPRYPPTTAGGGEISAQLLAEELRRNDLIDLKVYSFDGESVDKINGVSIHRLTNVPQYPYTLPNEIAFQKLRSVGVDCDILHAYNMHLNPAVGRLSNHLDVPAVATLNAYPLINWEEVNVTPSLKRRIYEKTVLRFERPRLKRQIQNIDLFFPLSSSVEQVYREHGFSENKFQIVPNMLDESFKIPERSRGETECTRLLYVGYLRDSKGVRYLIDAMDHLQKSFELIIVGSGPEEERLRSHASDSKAANRIELIGKVPYDRVQQLYAEADMFVHPGVWPEPFGRTILEAMQAGLPVVATNIGGPAETVPQKQLLCEPESPESLAEAVKKAVKHTDKIGSQNREFVYKHYHPDVVVPQFEAAYKQVLDTC